MLVLYADFKITKDISLRVLLGQADEMEAQRLRRLSLPRSTEEEYSKCGKASNSGGKRVSIGGQRRKLYPSESEKRSE